MIKVPMLMEIMACCRKIDNKQISKTHGILNGANTMRKRKAGKGGEE